MILHIIRHGDPDYENDSLTEFGWQEAHALSHWLKDIKIDKIYTSPLGRAIDTAKPTCEIKNIKSEILPWTAENMDYMPILENYIPDIFNAPQKDCTYKFSLKQGFYDFIDFTDTERMKTIDNMIKNSDDFLCSLGYERQGYFYKINRVNNESIAVFCHGGFGGAWASHLLGLSPGLFWPVVRLKTSSITTFHFNGSKDGYIRPMLDQLGDIPHIYKSGLRINNR